MTSISQTVSAGTSTDLVNLSVDADTLAALNVALEVSADCACALIYVYDDRDAV